MNVFLKYIKHTALSGSLMHCCYICINLLTLKLCGCFDSADLTIKYLLQKSNWKQLHTDYRYSNFHRAVSLVVRLSMGKYHIPGKQTHTTTTEIVNT